MNKFLFVFRTAYNFIVVVFFSLIFLPCISYSAALDWTGNTHNVVIHRHQFQQAWIPKFENIGILAIPVNFIAEDRDAVVKDIFGRTVTTVPIQKNGDTRTEKSANNAREDGCIDINTHPFLFLLYVFIGALIGAPLGYFLFMLFMCHLENIFCIDTLIKLKVPKFLYWDVNDDSYYRIIYTQRRNQ